MSNMLTPEIFKDVILELENQNLRKLEQEDKKIMITKILKKYEEMKKDAD